MQKKSYDLMSQAFNRWTVVARAESKHNGRQFVYYWRCICTCGTERDVRQEGLLSSSSQSCGCLTRERSSATHKKHGITGSVEYTAWQNMKKRCFGKHKYAASYAGRGITVCARLREDFEWFLAVVGYRPDERLTLDRKDNDGNYSCGHCPECMEKQWPLNLRWATHSQQLENTRRTRWLTVNDETLTISAWGKRQGFGHSTIRRRLAAGMSVEDAVLTPTH